MEFMIYSRSQALFTLNGDSDETGQSNAELRRELVEGLGHGIVPIVVDDPQREAIFRIADILSKNNGLAETATVRFAEV